MSETSIQALYAAAHEPKQFYLIQGQDHERRPFTPEFRTEVTTFLDECDGGPTSGGAAVSAARTETSGPGR
jgi:hypothetical protein